MNCSLAAFVLALVTGVSRQQAPSVVTITGRVVGASPGAELAVQCWLNPENEWRTEICEPDGSFTIDGLSLRRPPVSLHAVQKRAGDVVMDPDGTCSPEWQRMSPRLSVAPGARGVELRIPESSRYRMRVVDAGTGLPLAGVRVGLLGAFDFETGAVPDEVRAQDDGVYSIGFHRPDAGDGRALAVACESYERVAVGELAFAPGATQDLGTVELTRLAPTELFVADTDGCPVEGAAVTASIESNDEGCLNAHMVGSWPARRALPDRWSGTTSADGAATAFLSSRMAYWVGVKHPGYAQLWYRAVTEPRPPERIELRLLRPATISVRCVDERTGGPVAGEAVGYERIDTFEREQVRTGPDGWVSIENLVPGTYRFWPISHGRGFDEVVEVGDGACVEVTLPIRPLARER